MLSRPRVPLSRVPPLRGRLRAAGQLEEFLREHQPDAFSRRYAHCFPPAQHYLRTGGRATERLYNYMDVSRDLCSSAVTRAKPHSFKHRPRLGMFRPMKSRVQKGPRQQCRPRSGVPVYLMWAGPGP